MIRCIRLWTADDGNSRFEEGSIALGPSPHADVISHDVGVCSARFEATASGGSLEWHTAPVRQLVVTLSGTLDFETRGGERFTLRPGDVLLAEDTAGSGHRWHLTRDDPWHRMYLVLDANAEVPFVR